MGAFTVVTAALYRDSAVVKRFEKSLRATGSTARLIYLTAPGALQGYLPGPGTEVREFQDVFSSSQAVCEDRHRALIQVLKDLDDCDILWIDCADTLFQEDPEIKLRNLSSDKLHVWEEPSHTKMKNSNPNMRWFSIFAKDNKEEIRKVFGKTILCAGVVYGPAEHFRTLVKKMCDTLDTVERFITGMDQGCLMWLMQTDNEVHNITEVHRYPSPCVMHLDHVGKVDDSFPLMLGDSRIAILHQINRHSELWTLAEMLDWDITADVVSVW